MRVLSLWDLSIPITIALPREGAHYSNHQQTTVFLLHYVYTGGQQASQALKAAFTALMTSTSQVVSEQLNRLLERINERRATGQEISDCQGELLLRLHSQFPGDVGCFCIYFLNHITLEPGQAMFLGPNLPHAYLSGGG